MGTVAKFNRAVYDHIPYTDVTYSVHLQRRPKFYEKNIVIPTALIRLIDNGRSIVGDTGL